MSFLVSIIGKTLFRKHCTILRFSRRYIFYGFSKLQNLSLLPSSTILNLWKRQVNIVILSMSASPRQISFTQNIFQGSTGDPEDVIGVLSLSCLKILSLTLLNTTIALHDIQSSMVMVFSRLTFLILISPLKLSFFSDLLCSH